MAEKVECIVKGESDLYSDCRCITKLKTAANTYSRAQAHYLVDSTPGALYVEAAGSRVNVVAATREKLKYVRTAPNDTPADNLFKVREC